MYNSLLNVAVEKLSMRNVAIFGFILDKIETSNQVSITFGKQSFSQLLHLGFCDILSESSLDSENQTASPLCHPDFVIFSDVQ